MLLKKIMPSCGVVVICPDLLSPVSPARYRLDARHVVKGYAGRRAGRSVPAGLLPRIRLDNMLLGTPLGSVFCVLRHVVLMK